MYVFGQNSVRFFVDPSKTLSVFQLPFLQLEVFNAWHANWKSTGRSPRTLLGVDLLWPNTHCH